MMQSDARLLCDSMNWHARSLLAATGMLVASTLGDTYVVFFAFSWKNAYLAKAQVWAKMGRRFDAVGVTNQPHQSPSRPCVTKRNGVFGTVCSEESDLVT